MKKAIRTAALLLLCLFLIACRNEESVERPTYTGDWTLAPETYTTAPIYVRPEEEKETLGEEVLAPEDEDVVIDTGDGQTDDAGSQSSGNAESGSAIVGGNLVSKPKQDGQSLSWANIRAFPIKSSSMSTNELRNLCVDFFRYAKTALWKPSESIRYISGQTMTGNALYGGLPYVSMGSGNIYRLMDYLDESSGTVNMRDALDLNNTLDEKTMTYFGNQCSHGAFVGWGRVINSVDMHLTARMTKANGYIPVGEYTYDTEKITYWTNANGYRTTDVVRTNGEQVMYRSYAKLQIADGLVYYTTAGHVIMCSSAPHVEYGADGKIDGSKSYITIIDQGGTWEEHTTADGRKYTAKESVDAKITFSQLFQGKYVPFTFAEFLGTDPVEGTTCRFSHTDKSITAGQLFSGVISSNYGITDAYITCTDSNSTLLYKHAVRNTRAFGKTLRLAQTGANVDQWGSLKSGTYTVTVQAQLITGERPTVYVGTLTIS